MAPVSRQRWLTDSETATLENANENLRHSDDSVVDSGDGTNEEENVIINDQDDSNDANRTCINTDTCVGSQDELYLKKGMFIVVSRPQDNTYSMSKIINFFTIFSKEFLGQVIVETNN
jgi:hypothetical protein